MDESTSWEELKSSIKPLDKKGKIENKKNDLPPRLRVTRRVSPLISFTLDLHGYTVSNAYEALKKFILIHQKKGTQHVTIITGKGIKSPGLIKSEIMNWMDTPFFTEKIRLVQWKNDGGAVEITLKRNKK